jgi:hypothetical protein
LETIVLPTFPLPGINVSICFSPIFKDEWEILSFHVQKLANKKIRITLAADP